MLDDSAVLDRAFQAMSDPSRRQMVQRLALGPASVSELAEPLAMSLAAVVQHVQVLEASGLVRTEKAGRVRTCRLRPEGLRNMEAWVSDRRSDWEARFDRLGHYLQATGDDHKTSDHEDEENSP